MPVHDEAAAAPFDAVATTYDEEFTHSATGRLQREQVHRHLERLLAPLAPGDVLELGCGTGEDALFMARRGQRVLATDVSPAMLARARDKAAAAGVERSTRFETLDLRRVDLWPVSTRFDLLFSNFGALNCLSPEDLFRLGPAAARLVRPGGHALLVVMPRFCLWECAYFVSRLRLRDAFRRQRRGPLEASLGGAIVSTWYHSPGALRRAFAPAFRLVGLWPVGLCLPPSYLDRLFTTRRAWLARLARLERLLDWRALAGLADHYLIDLERIEDATPVERGARTERTGE